MEIMFPNCAGLDVHKQFVTACRLCTDARGRVHPETRSFGTMTDELEALAAWLAEGRCSHIVMESSGVYWQPLYNLLEERFVVWVVNARYVKQVPGRKTDVTDAEWLAQLLRHGLLRPSFIPSREQREVRDLVRYRLSLIEERSRILNRIQKVLEDTTSKLAAVVADLQGMTAQAILRALLAGQQEPAQLAELAQGKLRQKRAELERALVGTVRAHHRFVLAHLLGHLDFLDEAVAALDRQIAVYVEQRPDVQAALGWLDTIPGVSYHTAVLIVAEIGVELSRFPSAKHLTAWAGLVPGNNQSAGKQRPAQTRRGNRYLRRGLVQAARAAARSKDTYLRARYYRLAARRGKNRAAMAVARTILEIAYYLLTRRQPYHELGADYFERQDRERTAHRLLKRLSGLGYDVHVQEVALMGGM